MVESNVQEPKVRRAGEPGSHDGGAAGREGSGATLADRLACGLSEFFTRRRQSRPGLYAPLVRLERSD